MKKNRLFMTIFGVALISFVLICGTAFAESATPYASEEILSVSVSLSSGKKVVYDVTLTNQNYTVRVNYCNLYRENDSGSWEYIETNGEGIPTSTTGDMTTSKDLSRYITSSGKYQVRVSITSGSTTRYKTATRTY